MTVEHPAGQERPNKAVPIVMVLAILPSLMWKGIWAIYLPLDVGLFDGPFDDEWARAAVSGGIGATLAFALVFLTIHILDRRKQRGSLRPRGLRDVITLAVWALLAIPVLAESLTFVALDRAIL